MKVRGLDADGDWLFGKGLNDYKEEKISVAQNIQTVIRSFLGDCFFSVAKGIDWFNLLGSKDILKTKLIISTQILNIPEVTGIIEISVDVDLDRKLTVSYNVDTVYGIINNIVPIGVE